MKAALYGFRKIFVFALAVGALVYGLHESIAILREIDAEKATQAAVIAGGFFGALGTIFMALMSAFKGAYASGASPYAPPMPPVAPPPPPPG
jgi:hypothetical protein